MKDTMEATWHKTNSKAHLEDGMSFSAWNRLVYRQSFVQKETGRDRSHVPNTQIWDTD